jgi:hypothetical protein
MPSKTDKVIAKSIILPEIKHKLVIIMITQFFIIYVLSQQPQGQLQTQHSVDRSSYILNKHNIKSKSN